MLLRVSSVSAIIIMCFCSLAVSRKTRSIDMKISYKKLWVLLIQRDISKVTLRKRSGLQLVRWASSTRAKKLLSLFCYASAITLIAILGTSAKLYARKNSPAIKEVNNRDGTKRIQCGRSEVILLVYRVPQVVELLHEGKNAEQIKSLALNENLFAAPTTLRANQIYHTVTGRIRL